MAAVPTSSGKEHAMQGNCITRFMRIGFLVVVMAALMCALPLRPSLALADAEQQPTGYWKLVDVAVEKEEDVLDDKVYTKIYTATPGNHQASYSGLILETDTTESSLFVATCSPPPDTVPAGGDVVLQLSLTMTTQSCEHFHFRERAAVHRDDPGMGMGGVHRGYVDFVATQEDAPDSCSMWAIGDWGSDPDWVPSAEVHGIMPTSGSDSRRCIYFRACGAQTAWTYEWVEGDIGLATTDEEEDVFYAQVNQDELSAASDTPGESGSSGIIPTIIEGFDPSEGGLYTVLGAAALVTIGGVTYLHYRRRRNKDAKPENKKQEPRSAYRMLVYKDFGGELRAGDAPREVCARIEEIIGGYADPGNVLGAAVPGTTVAPGAKTKQRDDLTRQIQATGEAGLQVVGPVTFNGKYVVAKVQVPRQGGAAVKADSVSTAESSRRPTVVFAFSNPEAGTFTQRVAFKLAAEPQIAFVGKGSDGGFYSVLGSNRIGLLLEDVQGSPLYFEAENFRKAPTNVLVKGSSDSRLSAQVERRVDPKRPNAFVYEAIVKNSIPLDSIYGTWPIEAKLTITASNEEGESAEAEAQAFLWPEGIFVDTRQVRPERVFRDHILVDSSDILLSSGTQYNIEGATVEVGAAFKNDEGAVNIDIPNEPADGAYLKLKPADDSLSQKALDPTSSRIWYTLSYFQHPTYSKDELLGTLDLNPLMPLVSKDENCEYRGSTNVCYRKDGRFAQADIAFSLKGVGSDMYDADLTTERDRIYRLLAAYRPDDWSRIDAVLAKYGRQAEQDQQRLGTPEQRSEAGQTAIQLVKGIAHIQSLQRMRAIRKMVYETAEVTQVHAKVEANSEAALYNGLYTAASTVRWADDIAFTAWWYALLGAGAATYVEPLMTPLKDWLLGYVEQCGLALFDDEVKLQPEKYFSWDNLYENMIVPAIENEILAMVVGAVASGGVALAKNPKFYAALGAVGCFFFYKNYTKFILCDPATGKTELDLWGALKATMADFTLFGIKAIISVFIARKFAAKMDKAAPGKELFPVNEGDSAVDQFLTKKLKWLVEEPLLTLDDAAGKVFARTTKEAAGGVRNPDVFSADVFSVEGSWAASLSGNEQLEIWQAFFDACQQSGIGMVAKSDAAGAVGNDFDSWVRSLGSIDMLATTADGKVTTVKVSYLAVFSILVDQLFEQCGIDFGISFKGVLPEDIDYRMHDRLVDDINGIDGAQAEGEFLADPPHGGTGTSYNTSTSTGIDSGAYGSFDGDSGTGLDTGTDTSTGM